MMYRLWRPLWNKLKYNQKKEWDKIAYSYLENRNPVLDAGCGEGRFISRNPRAIIGLDWNTGSVNQCKNQGYNVCQGDIQALPFKDESMSGIHCSHVIEHFLPFEVHKILSEFNRVLCNGGILVIRSPLLWDKFYSDLTHIRPYNPEAIIHYLTPSSQRTLKQISQSFEVVALRWRYKPLRIGNRYFDAMFNILNRWGFPWIQKNGYMLVMKKDIKGQVSDR